MPIMPSTGPTPPTYPSDRADLWRAIEGLERRLDEPMPGLQLKPGVVTSLRPSVRVLGQSAPRDVWRVNDGSALAVGDEVLCSETALGLVVLSRVVVPVRGLDTPPLAPAGNLIPYPYPWPWATEGDTDPGFGDWITSLDQIGWGSDPVCVHNGVAGGIYIPYGVGLAAEAHASCLRFVGNVSPTASVFRVYCAAAGAAGIPVAAGAAYALSCHTAGEDRAHTVTVGVVWSDSAGAAVSTTKGAPLVQTEIGGESPTWTEFGDPLWVEGEGVPTATLTAPTGAAFARPFVEWDWTSSSDGYMDTASFLFEVAA